MTRAWIAATLLLVLLAAPLAADALNCDHAITVVSRTSIPVIPPVCGFGHSCACTYEFYNPAWHCGGLVELRGRGAVRRQPLALALVEVGRSK